MMNVKVYVKEDKRNMVIEECELREKSKLREILTGKNKANMLTTKYYYLE